MAAVRWGAATDSGQIRPDNEDNFLTESRVFAVADGMGGHRAGEVASAITVDLLRSRLSAAGAGLDEVIAAIAEANRDIYDAANENPDQQGMGTTVTMLALTGGGGTGPPDEQPAIVEPTSESRASDDAAQPTDEAARAEGSAGDDAPSSEGVSTERDEQDERDEQFVLANVGDSRTYLLRHNRLRRLTVDHNYVQELIAAGHITDDEARTHPRRNIVTRALGIDPTVRVDAWTLPVVRGDRFLLCSDGLVDEVRDDDIARVLTTITDPQTAADELVALANRQGGRDNVTVLVVDVLEGADPPDPDTELDLEPAWEEAAADSTWAADGPVEEEATAYADLAELVTPPASTDAATTTETKTPSTETRPRPITDEVPVVPPEAGPPPRRRRRRVAGFLWAIGVLAVLVLAFVILAAWARRGYFVAFDDGGEVVIYRGQPDGVLWFDPTEEAPTVYARSQLDERSVTLVDGQPEFDSRGAAERFINELLVTTTTSTTTTTTTTTVAPTTTTTTTTTVP